MTSGRYHIDLPGGGFPRDVQLAPPTDVMHDGTSSAGSTGGNVGAVGSVICPGMIFPPITIVVGQGFSGSAQGTADFGLLRAHADAGIENTPATIICPDIMPEGNSSPGRTSTAATASFDDFITLGSASNLPAGTMKHLRFTAVLDAAIGGIGLFTGSDPTNAVAHYSVSASVLFGSPTVAQGFNPSGVVETFPPSGESSAEVDVAVGKLFRYSGALDASAQASAGGGFAAASAIADASNTAHAYIDSDDPDVVLTSASLHDYRSSAVSTTTTTTTIPTTTTSTTTTSTTVSTGSTSSTTVPCTTARCRFDAALKGPACLSQTPPPAAVTKAIDRAESLIDAMASSTAKKTNRLRRQVKSVLKLLLRTANKAAKGKKPKLTAGCSADIARAANGALGGLGI